MSNSKFSDGGLPRGSKQITILESGGLFTASNIQWDTPTEAIRQKDHNNKPKAQRFDEDFTDGSATLQLASDSTIPSINDTFVVGDYGYQLTQVSEPFEQNAANVVNINFTRCVNPLIRQPVVDKALTQNTAVDAADKLDVLLPGFFSSSNAWISNIVYAATNLPTGLSISSSTGEITGTPTTVETTEVTITVTLDYTDRDGNVRKLKGVRSGIEFDVTA